MYRQTQSSFVDRKPFGRRASRSGDSAVPAEHPPSPPDTVSSHPRRPSHPDNFVLPTIPATPDMHESAGARFRRLAGIPTSQSGSREFRGASRPQTRWLVVLMPPSNLIEELSVGHRSPGKLSSGLLVPLFPTLFAQLAAIAKEFSLPSTTGLCLYLHLQDGPETPRITDDVWPLLWARHLHTDDASLPLGLPVAGRVQFDIDVPSARWYPMWFAHVSRKELVPDLARAIPTSPRAVEATLGDSIRGRGVPRPLALAPRQERTEVQIDSTPSPGLSPSPSPSKPAIPKSASKETVEKVRRWSALVTPDPAALRPDAPALPTHDSVPTEDTNALTTESTAVDETESVGPAEPEPLNLEDFQWSISSAGPPSPASSCATTASSRVPSIHILERAEGSVILTPTTATTWGPQYDSDVESELELDTEWHVRSPDIGERAEGSVLLTPSTATSWGAPLSYPPTPAQWAAMHELVRSPDIGERAEGSVLLTPSTATTWGAPLSYPPTPAQWYALQDHIMRTPDLGRRAEGSVLLTPSTATTWGPPSSYPATPEVARPREWVPSPGLGDREELSPGRVGRMSTMQWGTGVETEEQAYARMGLAWRWEFGWPVTSSPLPVVHEQPQAGRWEFGWPSPLPSAHEEPAARRWEFGWPMPSPLPGVREEAEEVEAGSARAEPVHDEASVSAESIQVRAIHVDDYERDESLSGSEHDVESLYDAPFGHDEEQEAAQEREFQFELELESPQVVLVNEERSYAAVEDSHGQEIDEAYAQEAEVSYGQAVEMDENYCEPSDYAPEDVSVSDASEDHASEASIEDGVFEYSYPDSSAQPSFPVSVSASDDAIGFPDLSPVVQPDSPFLDAAIAPRAIVAVPALVAISSVRTAIVTTAATTTLPAPTRNYGAYPYLVIYPSAYPHFDLYPSVSAASLQTRALNVNARALKTTSIPSPTESVRSASPGGSPRRRSIRSPPPSRKSSLSISVPTTRTRSRSILAVNPADRRSREWSKTLPPVPPVPHSVKSGSISSTASFKSAGQGNIASTLGRTREGSVGSITSVQEEVTSVNTVVHQLQEEDLLERRPSVVHDNAEFELLPSKKLPPQSLSSVYPYRYPENLEHLYPSKETIGYPANLETIYPVLAKVVRPALAVPVKEAPSAALSVGTKTSGSGKSLAIYLTGTYPLFNLYPAVYPHNLGEIYPHISSKPFVPSAPAPPAPAHASTSARSAIYLTPVYPVFNLYPAVYPHNLGEIYPSVSSKGLAHSAPARPAPAHASTPVRLAVFLARTYPLFDLYPAVYPHNLGEIYPSVSSKALAHSAAAAARAPAPPAPAHRSTPVRSAIDLTPAYPAFNLYPAVYPHNLGEIYPSVSSKALAHSAAARSPAPLAPTHASTSVRAVSASVPIPKARNVGMSRGYPFIELYPAVYPHNLECLYPSVPKGVVAPKSVSALNSKRAVAKAAHPSSQPTVVPFSLAYPFNLGNIYPKVYPFNLDSIYPTVSSGPQTHKVIATVATSKPKSQGPTPKSLGVRLARTYPNIELYAPVYPFNLDIYPSVKAENELDTSEDKVVGNSSESVENPGIIEIGKVQKNVPPAKQRKTHARLHAETWRKTHAQLVAEVLAQSAPVRPRKSHAELEAQVFPNGLPVAETAPISLPVKITLEQNGEQEPEVKPVLNPVPAPVPEPKPAPLVTPLRRQRSGTIMRPSRTESLSVPHPFPQGVDLDRPRSVVEARAQIFERTPPSRSQTAGPQGPLTRTLVRQKSANFERAKSMFHVPEETQSEGSRTPPRPTRRVSKLDMSKFGFA